MANRRKSLMPSENITLKNQQDEDINDDEEEKRRRVLERQQDSARSRSHRSGVDPRLSIAGRKSIAPGALLQAVPSAPPPPKPSNEQLSLLYNNCVKLLNENKINAKNAFQLKLIDYMSDIVLNKEISGGATNFQVVGCTIDVGTKIYAARVDALHQNTYQVLSGLAHGANEENGDNENTQGDGRPMNDEDNEDADNDDEEQANQNKKAAKGKKKRIKKSSHIVENLDTITAKLKDEYQDEDLYFSKISTCIENEGISGILLNKLHIANDSGMLLIDKEERQDPAHHDFRASTENGSFRDVINFYKGKGIDLRGFKLGSGFNFKFKDWDVNPDDDISKLIQKKAAAEEEENLEEHRFDANQVHSRLNLTNDFGNDIDVDIDVDNMDNINVDNMDMGEAGRHEMSEMSNLTAKHSVLGTTGEDKIDDIRSLHSVADLTSLISTTSASDYSYFNFDQLRLHNLPKHLKLVAHQLAAANQQRALRALNGAGGDNQQQPNGEVQQLKAKNKKEAPKLQFFDNDDLLKFFKVTKKNTFLADLTLEKRSERPIFMESERQTNFDSKEFFQPFWKKIKAKILSDGQQVENLLIGNNEEGLEAHQAVANKENIRHDEDDYEPAIGGIDDDFVIPNTAQTNGEPVFFSQNGGEFNPTNGMDGVGGAGVGDNMSMLNMGEMQPFDDNNLVEAPVQINAINLEYAKTAKNIDVRRLKQIIWSMLCDETEDKENTTATESSLNASKDASAVKRRICASLKDIYNRLRPPVISQRVFEDLSVCIVFQMLLFLANEHSLVLKNDPLGSDVMITSI